MPLRARSRWRRQSERPPRENVPGTHQRQLKGGVAVGGLEVTAEQHLECLAGIADLLGGAGEVGHAADARADHRGQQRLLTREMAVERAHPQAGVGGDLLHLSLVP